MLIGIGIGIYLLIGFGAAYLAGTTTREMQWQLMVTWLPELVASLFRR